MRIKPMETDEEIRGKAFVHWKCWQEVYPGLVSQEYLDNLTLEKTEEKAFQWRDNILVAKDGDGVVGFVGYGKSSEADTGEVFALYVLPEYHGTGVGRQLMDSAMEKLSAYPRICLWLVKGNGRAVRFYEKCGFHLNGVEKLVSSVGAEGLQMVKEK
ncbi:MAG: GNAT family N-acetyltransferase [Clostridia bacterium]|nr:GNAT family N-acetyltransferase [Clostridia bacterium]